MQVLPNSYSGENYKKIKIKLCNPVLSPALIGDKPVLHGDFIPAAQ